MYYIEITLLPSMNIAMGFLWKKIFHRIHLRLVSLQDKNGCVPIGISFPEYSLNEPIGLGSKLRIFGESRDMVASFGTQDCLRIFSDYVHSTGVREVIEPVDSYVRFCRFQPQASKARLARRKARREGIPYEEALRKLQKLNNEAKQTKTLPYILMKSDSSGKGFSLFIRKMEGSKDTPFLFNSYGLSKGGSVPDF